MRSLVVCLSLCTFLSSMAHAQLTWSQSSYPFSSSSGQRADFTGDGFADLTFVDGTGANLTVLPNSGNGSFDPSRAFTTNQQGPIALLDFNRDGKTDVAACDGQNLVVLLGNGDGTVTASQTVPVSCSGVVAADFNRDSNPDIAVTVDGARCHGLLLANRVLSRQMILLVTKFQILPLQLTARMTFLATVQSSSVWRTERAISPSTKS